MSTVKLIVVPGRGIDLFSLKKGFGIKKGPVKTPIALPIETIGELVNQYNRPEIFEVVVESVQKYPTEEKIYSKPVLLTSENYKLPYHEIAGTEPVVAVTVEDIPNSGAEEIEDPIENPEITDTTDAELQTAASTEEVVEETVIEEVIDLEVKEETTEENLEVVETKTEEIIEESEVSGEETESNEETEVGDEKDPILQMANNKNKHKKNR